MNMGIAIAIILVMLLVFTAGGFYVRYKLYEVLQAEAADGDLDRFFKHVDGVLAKLFLSVYARERLRFLGLARRGDKALMAQQFNALMTLKLNDAQKAMLLADGFNAFAAVHDRKHAERILAEMPAAGMTDKQLAAYRRHFDIVLAGKTKGYLAPLENTYATLSGKRRGYAAYLLFKIHEQLKDGKADAYRDEAARLYAFPASELNRRIHVNTTV